MSSAREEQRRFRVATARDRPFILAQGEQVAVKQSLDAEDQAEPKAKGFPYEKIRKRLLQRCFENIDLTQAEETKASDTISKWYCETMAARMKGESKLVSDLKRARDKSLRAALGRKKAGKVINNLNALSGPPRR